MAARNESPAVARHRLRVALRKAREATGLTQGQVAKQLEISLSKVNRIEAGEVTVSRADLQALLQLYAITDPERVKDLLDEARTSRAKGWWDEPKYRDHLTPAMIQLIQFEESAEVIRIFQPTTIPGVLQTRAYAEVVLNFWSDELSKEQRLARIEARQKRHAGLFDREDAPLCLIVLDESVLWREIGGPRVMARQIDELTRLAAKPNVSIRVVPLSEGAPALMLGAFHLCDVGNQESVLYRESHLLDEVVEAPEKVQRHQLIFGQMWNLALPEESSIHQIEARAAALRASLDRR